MPKLVTLFFFLLSSFQPILLTSADFIKTECQSTHYPSLCVQCLSNYTSTIQQNPRQLAHAALSVSLIRAQSTASFVSKLAKLRGISPTVHDCVQNMAGSVDQLSRSLKELGVADQDFGWHMGNVQTWVSSALTYENMCLDGSVDGSVKAMIRRRVVDCAQVTSNALALVNRFAARHRKRGAGRG